MCVKFQGVTAIGGRLHSGEACILAGAEITSEARAAADRLLRSASV